jgi:NAD(P)-dependent dehydrogenase (short-subunit alcohol dehydrogenase family)
MIKQRQGRIINIASIAGLRGSPATTAYCASKGGIRLMTKALAVEWARHGILVNAVCPGIFITGMTDETMKNEETAKGIIQKVPLGRAASPEELVGTIVFLSSRASEYMTGTEVVVDGGWTAGL